MQDRNTERVYGSRTGLESPATEGDSPVGETRSATSGILSSAGLVESRVNPGGPPPKAKYLLTTDSGQVTRVNNEKYPDNGSEIVA